MLAAKDPKFTGIRSLCEDLLGKVQPRSLFRLEISFQGTPSREEALDQMQDALVLRFRDARITNLEDHRIKAESQVLLDSIIPSISYSGLKTLSEDIAAWYRSDLENHAVYRIQPSSGGTRHALALISIEDDRAQALLIELSSPE